MALHSSGLYTRATELKHRCLPNPRRPQEKKKKKPANGLKQLRTSQNLNLFTYTAAVKWCGSPLFQFAAQWRIRVVFLADRNGCTERQAHHHWKIGPSHKKDGMTQAKWRQGASKAALENSWDKRQAGNIISAQLQFVLTALKLTA